MKKMDEGEAHPKIGHYRFSRDFQLFDLLMIFFPDHFRWK
jgi:hypothetical protein